MYHCREVDGEPKNKCIFPWPRETIGWREFDGYVDLFPEVCKMSQWMILHTSAVEYLRSSESGKLLLMYSEHTLIPDEMFFATILSSSPLHERTFSGAKRLMWWDGGSHPHQWSYADQEIIQNRMENSLWIRKVDVRADQELKKFLDDLRQADRLSSQAQK